MNTPWHQVGIRTDERRNEDEAHHKDVPFPPGTIVSIDDRPGRWLVLAHLKMQCEPWHPFALTSLGRRFLFHTQYYLCADEDLNQLITTWGGLEKLDEENADGHPARKHSWPSL